MKVRTAIKLALPALIFGAGAFFVYLDTASYRAALKEFEKVAKPEFLTHELALTSNDIQGAVKCNRSQALRDNAWRKCIVPVLSRIDSENGAIVATTQAVRWLKDHPDDAEMQAAARVAISRGWRAYKRNLPVLNAQQSVIDARRKSLVFELVDGQSDASSLVESRARALKTIEMSIEAARA